jgi:hypothetical protein
VSRPVRRPAFRLPVTPEDLIRHALAAYYRAVGDSTAPEGDPNPASWSDPEEFVRVLLDFFELRLRAEACRGGHPIDADLARFDRWNGHALWRDQHLRDVDPEQWAQLVAREVSPAGGGRSPPDKGQGWPALVPAVGPAPMPCPEARDGVASQPLDITTPANPLLFGQQVQELPGETSRVTVNQSGEKLS